MKWYEFVAAGILAAVVVLVVITGLEQRPAALRIARAPELAAESPNNVTLVRPPTIHERRKH